MTDTEKEKKQSKVTKYYISSIKILKKFSSMSTYETCLGQLAGLTILTRIDLDCPVFTTKLHRNDQVKLGYAALLS